MIPDATREHYARMQRLQVQAIRLGRLAKLGEAPSLLTAAITDLQVQAAEEGATYAAMTLAQQGAYTPPSSIADTSAFAGYASDGRPLGTLLELPSLKVRELREAGMGIVRAIYVAREFMDRIMTTQVADAARQAAGVDIATRSGVGYVRMVNQPSCPRCTILGGKWFRWNEGFLRHPRCDCVHVPNRAGSLDAAISEGLIDDPYESFAKLSAEDQERLYGKANAAAIRDGADISQVVNARRGMTPNGNFTAEGTTVRGNAAIRLAPGQRRMTPELIYRQSKTRAEALELLEHHGYVLPGGQVPTGALIGRREGFGQMGRGGKRAAAVSDIEKARASGVRDPRNRNTMTSAERRLYDAEQNYLMALSGRSPYTSPGFGNTPDPYRQRLNRTGAGSDRAVTQTELATAEREYRRLLSSRGQRFIN